MRRWSAAWAPSEPATSPATWSSGGTIQVVIAWPPRSLALGVRTRALNRFVHDREVVLSATSVHWLGEFRRPWYTRRVPWSRCDRGGPTKLIRKIAHRARRVRPPGRRFAPGRHLRRTLPVAAPHPLASVRGGSIPVRAIQDANFPSRGAGDLFMNSASPLSQSGTEGGSSILRSYSRPAYRLRHRLNEPSTGNRLLLHLNSVGACRALDPHHPTRQPSTPAVCRRRPPPGSRCSAFQPPPAAPCTFPGF